MSSFEHIAPLGNEHATRLSPHGPFLAAAGHPDGVRIDAALDLACGTALLTRQLLPVAHSIVGLDRSEAMLCAARARPNTRIRYVQGDFRRFQIDTVFDAVSCGGNSLSYVESPHEPTDVGRCVRAHLRPGGLFRFDVLDHQHMTSLAPRSGPEQERGREEQINCIRPVNPPSPSW